MNSTWQVTIITKGDNLGKVKEIAGNKSVKKVYPHSAGKIMIYLEVNSLNIVSKLEQIFSNVTINY